MAEWSFLRSYTIMTQQRSTLRFPFAADAEIAPENSPRATIPARVRELGLYGCYLDTAAPFSPKTQVVVKIFTPTEYFEAKATVIYVDPASGMGLAFRNVKPNFVGILRTWLLSAIQNKQTDRT